MSESRYTITVTAKQAQMLSRACEILARLGIGQFRDALEELPLREYLPRWWSTDMEVIGKILSAHMQGNISVCKSNLSIHAKQVSDTSRMAWDLYQVIRHRLAWDRAVAQGIITSRNALRKWPEMMQVWYDEPVKTSEEPLAKIERIKEHESARAIENHEARVGP